jgi:hypothetical protein
MEYICEVGQRGNNPYREITRVFYRRGMLGFHCGDTRKGGALYTDKRPHQLHADNVYESIGLLIMFTTPRFLCSDEL